MATKWITSAGQATPVMLMETSHLHYTIRLIWNTFMPEPLHLGPGKITVFANKHPPEYLAEVSKALYSELLSRDDVQPWMLEELDHMQLNSLLEALK